MQRSKQSRLFQDTRVFLAIGSASVLPQLAKTIPAKRREYPSRPKLGQNPSSGLAKCKATCQYLAMTPVFTRTITCLTPEATGAFAARLGAVLGAGDTVLLSGPVGAGKSHFARALIQSRLAALGRHEDVPSPTFTLVQTYDLDIVEIWHADLYRLHHPSECDELGLDVAFEQAICLIEWPDRLGALAPARALYIALAAEGESCARVLHVTSNDPGWQDRLAPIWN